MVPMMPRETDPVARFAMRYVLPWPAADPVRHQAAPCRPRTGGPLLGGVLRPTAVVAAYDAAVAAPADHPK
jgi:hypothetical protein